MFHFICFIAAALLLASDVNKSGAKPEQFLRDKMFWMQAIVILVAPVMYLLVYSVWYFVTSGEMRM